MEDNSRSDRVNIPETVGHIYDELTLSNEISQSPFRTMKDVFMLAASVGFAAKNRTKLPSGARRTIRREVFKEQDELVLKALALADTLDVNVLGNWGEILTIAEEYALTGIYELQAHLINIPGENLWNLVSAFLDKEV